eukprot:m51a1_g6375 Transmembrane 9 superfamily member 3 (579) ;mRNA; f:137850-140246
MITRALLAALLFVAVVSGEGNRYTLQQETFVWVHSIGPFNNPNEIYNYFSLPLCKPDSKTVRAHAGLSESLLGYELVRSQIRIQFGVSVDDQEECLQKLEIDDVNTLREAIRQQYWYQWFYDDLPVWGTLGVTLRDPTTDVESPFIYTHRDFVIAYNNDRVVEVTLNSSSLRPLDPSQKLQFTYSVRWVKSTLPWSHRWDRYLDKAFFEHQIHWFSLFNALMLMVFLLGVVVMILLRTVHRDISKAEDIEDAKDDMSDESGWKQVAGDVFRQPEHPTMFAALVGSGYQLASLLLFLFFVASFGSAYVGRGRILSWFLALYSLASVIGGYKSGAVYAQTKGRAWIRTALLTAAVFPALTGSAVFVLNSVAAAFDSMATIHFGSQVEVVSVWAFVVVPLTFVGTLAGRHFSATSASKSKNVSQYPQPVPEHQWYEGRTACIVLGGLLPFGAVFIEMFFVFAGLWHYKYYYVYGFLLLVYLVLLVVTACVNVIATYYLLNTEDYRWQWTAFWSGASTGAYSMLYALYYYNSRTMMSGALQSTFFFCTTGLMSLVLGLVCGAVGFVGAESFVRRIYDTGKTE